jgi:RimJ/RimL family protein N-acetyltransferase
MQKLEENQYESAGGLFAGLAETHFSVGAVLAGTAHGEIWVDDVAIPRVGLAATSEGHYLAGDAQYRPAYAGLKEILPHNAYLNFEPVGWENVLGDVWNNTFARKHLRQNYRFAQQRITDWQARVPPGYQLAAVDYDLLGRTDLEQHDEIAGRVEEWLSPDFFMKHGFGWVILHGSSIASRCIADCVNGEQCEMGVGTSPQHRKRGLGSIVVAAALDDCLRKGYRHIGWHCLSSNAGSIGVALKTGFVKVRDYFAYSSVPPAENVGDLTLEECRDWAAHYEKASESIPWYRFYAAGAWALAGEEARALNNLDLLVAGGWQGKPEWLESNYMFSGLQELAEFKARVAELRRRQAAAAI